MRKRLKIFCNIGRGGDIVIINLKYCEESFFWEVLYFRFGELFFCNRCYVLVFDIFRYLKYVIN